MAPGAGLAFQRHPAAVQLDQRLDQRQAQARPAAVAADEAVEDVRLDVEGDAAPGVGDAAAAPRRSAALGAPASPGRRRRRLAQARSRSGGRASGPAAARRRGSGRRRRRAATSSGTWPASAAGAQRPAAASSRPRDVDVAPGRAPSRRRRSGPCRARRRWSAPSWVGGRAHRRHMAAAALGQGLAGALQQFGIADDGGERRAQLVGDVADEIALQPLGLGQRRFAVAPARLSSWRVSVTSAKAIRVAPSGRGRDWKATMRSSEVLGLAGDRRAGLRVGVGDAAPSARARTARSCSRGRHSSTTPVEVGRRRPGRRR